MSDLYVDADRLTYQAIAPEYERYVSADSRLSADQKQRRLFTLDTWRKRIETAEAGR